MERRSLCALVAIALGIVCMLGIAAPSQAYVYSSDNQWASWSSGSYTVYNDVWNPSGGTQWLNINNWNSWNLSSDFSGGGVKSYGNVSFSPYTAYNGYGIWAYFNTSTPGGAAYDNSFDCWDNSGDEIMIWENWNNVGPAGSLKYSNITAGGSTWNVYQGNVGHNCVSFLRTSQRHSGTEEVTAVIQWANQHGLIGGNTINQVQFGFEVTSTSGWQSFYLNGYNAGW